MHLLTGSRFGSYEPSVVLPLFLKIWNDSPITGFGVLVSGPYVFDNAYVEFFLYGGVVGLFLCLGILLVIFWTALQGLRTDSQLGRLLMTFWILIIGASIGAPVLTLNRSSIFCGSSLLLLS